MRRQAALGATARHTQTVRIAAAICRGMLVGCALAAALGCGGADSSSGAPPDAAPDAPGDAYAGPVEPPRDFEVTAGPSWGHATVRWTPPAGAVDNYEVQASVNGWVFVGSKAPVVPGDATQAEIDFTRVAPELTEISLHVRAHRGSAARSSRRWRASRCRCRRDTSSTLC
jgi:hypothetical protein